MNVINVHGVVVFRDGVFFLKLGKFETPLTIAQFAELARVSTVQETEVARCTHRNMYGAPCIKLPGHKSKHQYLKKQFKKPRATAPSAHAVVAPPAKESGTGDWRAVRRAKGLCSFCNHKPIKNKKLCAKHLKIARRAMTRARGAKALQRRAA